MTRRLELSLDSLMEHGKAIEATLQEATRQALLDHKRAGNPIAVWRDGRVVILAPEDIPVVDPLQDKTK